MSYGYQVSLRIQELISTSDEIRHRLDLRDILAREEMLRLLVEALEDVGFAKAGDEQRLVRDEGEGMVTTVDLETLEVVTALEIERNIDVQVDGYVDLEERRPDQAEPVMRARVLRDQEARANLELNEILEAGEGARVEELNRVLEQVYSRALKTRAAQLGDVLEVSEGTNEDGQYELVIKVEI